MIITLSIKVVYAHPYSPLFPDDMIRNKVIKLKFIKVSGAIDTESPTIASAILQKHSRLMRSNGDNVWNRRTSGYVPIIAVLRSSFMRARSVATSLIRIWFISANAQCVSNMWTINFALIYITRRGSSYVDFNKLKNHATFRD